MPAKTILLVDDDRVVLTLMHRVLEQKGYRILTASDGNMAMALAEQEGPDLVIVDLMMPQRSGFQVVEKLKSGPKAGPHVIMITSHEGERHRAHAETLGVDDYLRKPFTPDQLLASVERLCPVGQDPL